MDLLRSLPSPLRSADTYRRWVYLVIGGALYVPFAVAALVFVTVLEGGGTGSLDDGVGATGLGSAVVAALLGGSTAWFPAVRRQQYQLVRSLIRGPLAEDPVFPAESSRARWRAAVWTTLHLAVGFAVSLATMVLLTEAALLALSAIAEQPATMFSDRLWFLDADSPTGMARLLGPLAGAILLVATTASVAVVGAAAAQLAPMLLGPSMADRLAAAEERNSQLAHRSQLAAELHDSLGHALSVVALHAGTAARVIDHDPDYVRDALETIADEARNAASDLDHVLGALREERPLRTPQHTLDDLPELLETVRTTGVAVSLVRRGGRQELPPAVSREAYRLFREGLTNALRHGAPEGPIEMILETDDSSLRLTITNPAPDARTGRTSGGRGIAGMRERVAVLGGDLHAGRRGENWHLTAALPLGPGG